MQELRAKTTSMVENYNMKLTTLTKEQVQQAREWRNAEPQFLRTPHLITEQMQSEFFDRVINDRDSKHRYFAVISYGHFIGMGGLTNIEWENGTAEISLIINPEYRGKGKGTAAVELLLDEAFNKMRLYSVYGEVYECGNKGFWETMAQKKCGYTTGLKHRKYYNGKMNDSMWFSFARKEK